jgi:hypothetical protein
MVNFSVFTSDCWDFKQFAGTGNQYSSFPQAEAPTGALAKSILGSGTPLANTLVEIDTLLLNSAKCFQGQKLKHVHCSGVDTAVTGADFILSTSLSA